MAIKKHIPNGLTCGNLFSGCIAVVAAVNNNIDIAAIAIVVAALFDFFDGMAARLLKVSSNIGKDLDSLADMVSFGVVPGILMYKMLENIHWSDFEWISYFGFIITVFSGLRLAKFNNDSRQSDSFIGLPTPANTLLITSIALIAVHNTYDLASVILQPLFLLALSVLSAFLMVAELPLLALKFKTFSWKKNELRYLLIVSSAGLLAAFNYAAVPVIIGLYIILSVYNNQTSPKMRAGC